MKVPVLTLGALLAVMFVLFLRWRVMRRGIITVKNAPYQLLAVRWATAPRARNGSNHSTTGGASMKSRYRKIPVTFRAKPASFSVPVKVLRRLPSLRRRQRSRTVSRS